MKYIGLILSFIMIITFICFWQHNKNQLSKQISLLEINPQETNLIVFFQIDCNLCKKEISQIKEYQRYLKEIIFITNMVSEEDAHLFISNLGINDYRLFVDHNASIATALNIQQVPYTILTINNKIIRFEGYITKEDIITILSEK